MDINYTVLDLFSGCGGLSKGFADKGFTILGGADIDEHALKTFKKNFPQAQTLECDLSAIAPAKLLTLLGLIPEQIDVLVSGPPCQGFSRCKNSNSAADYDDRNELVFTFLNFVKFIKPPVVLIENVPELYYNLDGKTRRRILRILRDEGYTFESKIVPLYDYGLPQKRRRYFILASRIGEIEIPEGKAVKRTAWDAMSDLPVVEQGEGVDGAEYALKPQNAYQRRMRKNSSSVYNHLAHKSTAKQTARIKSLGPGESLIEAGNNSLYANAYGRLDFDNPAPTVTASAHHIGAGRYIHPREDRMLTVRELARLQSFPDDFIFEGSRIQQIQQIGNAVPPMFVESLANEMKKALRKYKATLID